MHLKNSARLIKILLWIARFIHTQLFIILISLPILLWWGLPFSLLSILGNLIFAPFLSTFLILASLLFFSELLSVPNGIVVWLLEYLTTIWLWSIQHAGNWWLFALPKPPLWWCIVLPFITLCIVMQLLRQAWVIKIGSLFLVLIVSCTYLKLVHAPKKLQTTIACARSSVTLLHANNVTVLIDQGALNGTPSPENWIEYTLLPELNKLIGSTTIDHYMLLHPGQRSLKGARALVETSCVKNLYFPYWKGDATKQLLREYGMLKQSALEKQTTIHRVGSKPVSIKLGKQEHITLCPEKKLITTSISFPEISLQIVV